MYRRDGYLGFLFRKEGYIEELKKVAGEGIDLVLEMLANVNLSPKFPIKETIRLILL